MVKICQKRPTSEVKPAHLDDDIERRAMSRISGLRNDMNKRTFNKDRKINNRCFYFLSNQNIIVPLILDINEIFVARTTWDGAKELVIIGTWRLESFRQNHA